MTFTSIDPTLTPNVLPKAGGTMSGNIAMGTNKVTGIGNGTAAQDVPAYGQVGVLQTVTTTYATLATSTTSSFADTGATITIVPKVATSRIIIRASVPVRTASTGGAYGTDLSITDNSNNVVQTFIAVWLGNDEVTGNTRGTQVFITGVDTPGSTASKTYKIRFARNVTQTDGSTSTCYAGFGQTTMFIEAQEVQ